MVIQLARSVSSPVGQKKCSDGLTSVDFFVGERKGFCIGQRHSLPNTGKALNATTFFILKRLTYIL